MTPKMTSGTNFRGGHDYLAHDKNGETSHRLEHTHTVNLPTQNIELAWKVMAFTALNSKQMQKKAGIRPGGRKGENPVLMIALPWHPEQNPTWEHMVETGLSTLKHLGLSERQAIFYKHKDEPQPHLHMMINRVHPETGLFWDDGRSHTRLQEWALEYQRQRGEKYCPQREINSRLRAERKRDKSRPVVRYRDPVIAQAWERSDSGKAFAAALKEQGYRLARGDRRTAVIVDRWGKVHNPARHIDGLNARKLRQRLSDTPIPRLPAAKVLQYEARKQARIEYNASINFDEWSTQLRNDMQTRHIEERAKLNKNHYEDGKELRERMSAHYKLDEKRKEIEALKAQIAAPPTMQQKLTDPFTKRREDLRERLEVAEKNLANAEWRYGEYIDTHEGKYQRDLSAQTTRQEEEKQWTEQHIAEEQPRFYRDEVQREIDRERDKTIDPNEERERRGYHGGDDGRGRDDDGGRERGGPGGPHV